jgi:hypothetical protein
MMEQSDRATADISDRATEAEERAREVALKNQLAKYKVIPFIGKCHNCEEPLNNGRRFCDLDCRNDFDYRLKRAFIYVRS